MENFRSGLRPSACGDRNKEEFVANKSKQCKYCHQVDRMDFEAQGRTTARLTPNDGITRSNRASIVMLSIAHKLPEDEPEEVEEEMVETTAMVN
ncbi:NapC/NirT family cytochrome c [Vibrio sp. M60_M31a]